MGIMGNTTLITMTDSSSPFGKSIGCLISGTGDGAVSLHQDSRGVGKLDSVWFLLTRVPVSIMARTKTPTGPWFLIRVLADSIAVITGREKEGKKGGRMGGGDGGGDIGWGVFFLVC